MNWQVISIGVGVLMALIGIIYAALLWEVRKLRKASHDHGNMLTAHAMMLEVIRRKLDL